MDDYEGPDVAQPFTADQLLRDALQARTRISAETLLDLSAKGPVFDLLQAKREAALKALDSLIDVNPLSTHEIIALQEQVKSFLADCEWIHARLELGREADAQIQEIWGTDHGDRSDDTE